MASQKQWKNNSTHTQPLPIETKVFDKLMRAIHKRSFFFGALCSVFCFKYQFSSYCFVNLLKRSIEAPHFIRIDTLLDASRADSSRVLCTKWINYCYVSMCDVCHIAIGLNIYILFNFSIRCLDSKEISRRHHRHRLTNTNHSYFSIPSIFSEQNRMESVECFQPIDFHNTMNAKYGYICARITW